MPSFKIWEKNPSQSNYKAAYFIGGIALTFLTLSFISMVFAVFLNWGGIRTMYVVSDSMVPTFSKGDLLLVSTHSNSLAPGDIIAYSAPWVNDQLVTHRIQSMDDLQVIAKGDANALSDPAFPRTAIYGEIVSSIPKLGYLFNPYAICGLATLALILSTIADRLRPKARHKAPEVSLFRKWKEKHSQEMKAPETDLWPGTYLNFESKLEKVILPVYSPEIDFPSESTGEGNLSDISEDPTISAS
mgnify:CR=1 FL=1|jgi:signal peptidase I